METEVITVETVDDFAANLAEYAEIPIAFEASRLLDVSPLTGHPGKFALTEHASDAPFVKDYDSMDRNGPFFWRRHFDISNWAMFAARSGGRMTGGAVVAFDTPDVDMLEGRRDLALLWDIRVAPPMRGKGIGSALLQAAEDWALTKRATVLKVETQNINVPACRFYERRGFTLRVANAGAYADFPEETQLLWYKELRR